jgi:hypothetical protein
LPTANPASSLMRLPWRRGRGRFEARYRLFDRVAALTNNVNGFAHGVEEFEMAGHALRRPRVSNYSNQCFRV